MATPPPLRRTDWAARLRARDTGLAARVLAAYRRMMDTLQRAADVAASEAGALRGEGLLVSSRLNGTAERLRAAIEREAAVFAPGLAGLAREAAEDGVEDGIRAAGAMIAAQTGAAIAPVHSAALAEMIGIVDGAPFRQALERFGPAAGQRAADILITGVAAGLGPERIARRLRDFVAGEMRVWAETMARTALLSSFRRASHESYRANADVVGSWMWWASLGPRTCLSCISLHGQVFPLTETLNDHHRGRCVALPVVRGTGWSREVTRGPDWFDGLTQREQRAMMGPSAWASYRRGEWDWGRASVTYEDAIYGTLRRAATLGEMGIERVR